VNWLAEIAAAQRMRGNLAADLGVLLGEDHPVHDDVDDPQDLHHEHDGIHPTVEAGIRRVVPVGRYRERADSSLVPPYGGLAGQLPLAVRLEEL
jgi:hypothetical protein